MSKEPVIETPHQALARAITKAIEEPLSDRLSDARFGRYAAEGAGWNWHLEFRREVGDSGKGDPDVMARRVSAIISAWERDVARYMTTAER